MQNLLLHAISLKLAVWAAITTIPWVAIYALSHAISGVLRSHQAFSLADFGYFAISLFVLTFVWAWIILRRSNLN